MTLGAAIQESSKLEITAPKSLAEKFTDATVPGSPAMFGNFPFGHSQSISGRLIYAHPADDKEGCTDFSEADKKSWPQNAGALVVMVDRGDCHFVEKVRHVQNAGGVAAIIVDNIDERRKIYMADDGTGGNIAIPSLCISKKDGDTLKEELAAAPAGGMGGVAVKFSWNLPHPDNRVEWDFWTSSDNAFSIKFKKEFAPVAEALGKHTLMSPHYEFVDGKRQYNCFHEDPKQRICGNQCTNQGRYCSFDPDDDLEVGLSGADVARENIRQRLLWLHCNATDQSIKWWEYVVKFDNECATVEKWGEECSFRAMDEIEVAGGSAKIKELLEKVGGYGEEDKDNSVVDDELALAGEMNIFSYPTLLINNFPFRGDLSCPGALTGRFDRNQCNVLLAICTGFKDLPDVCTSDNSCPLGSKKDDCGKCGGTCFGCATDECGTCMKKDSKKWNQRCMDCNKVPHGDAKIDDCQHCDGPGRDVCGHCTVGDERVTDIEECGPKNNTTQPEARTVVKKDYVNNFPTWGVVLIVLGCVGIVGGGVFVYMRRREDAMRQDIDSLLKQYLPMGQGDEEVSVVTADM